MHTPATAAFWLVNILSLAAAGPINPGPALSGGATNYKNCGEFIPNEYIISLDPLVDITKHLSWINSLNLGGLAGVTKQYGFEGFKGYAGTFNPVTIALIKASKDVLEVSQDSWSCPTGLIDGITLAQVETREPDVHVLDKRANVIEQTNAPVHLRVISQRPYPKTNSYYHYDSLGYGSFSYVIDSGIQITHQEFQNHARNAWTAYNGNFSDVGGHGTFVAGLIGGKTYGVAKATLLLSVKVFNDGQTQASTVLDGYNWAVNDIITNGRTKKSVINMSLLTGYIKAFNDAITAANNQNIFTVVAAGNNKADVANYSPASCPEAYTVAATNDNYVQYGFANQYSNYGALVDVLAPGTNLQSAAIGPGDNRVGIATGTSLSTPLVAGGIATFVVQNDFNKDNMASFVPAAASMNAISGLPAGTPNKLFYNWSGR